MGTRFEALDELNFVSKSLQNHCWFKQLGTKAKSLIFTKTAMGEEHNVVFGQGHNVSRATSTLSPSLYVS